MKSLLRLKNYLFLASAFLLANCGTEPKALEKPVEEVNPSKLSVLEPLFKDLIIQDTFFVYAQYGNDKPYVFKGKAMDSLQVQALSSNEAGNYSYFKDFGACFKFTLDSTHLGLIARVPGEYESTAIKLFVFDVRKDSVIQTIHLADVFGDAGETMSYSSCIFYNKEHKLTLATYCHSEYNHSVDNENDTTVERWNNFYLLDLSDQHLDTLSKDSATITDRFPAIIKRLERY